MQANIVMAKWTAEMLLTRPTARMAALTPSFNARMENVSLEPLFVTMTMTVETGAMNTLAHMHPAKGISSLAQVDAAFIRAGSVMETMTAKIMLMRSDVKVVIETATQVNGPALYQGNVCQLANSAMGLQTVLVEKMKQT
uniref:Uncharacterized protein n=1 Tax=Sphaerodactylus townsendi TaxID=933632 RepID=A0ACB8G0E9_9SAUR